MKTTIKQYFEDRRKDEYQRENYDTFLRKVKFNFDMPSIHIAGSNGKGQTANYIASIYSQVGYKVGLFTSPYFSSPCESIRVNNTQISEEEMSKIIDEYYKLIDKYELSEFEILTFVAFEYFKKSKCDLAVIECGMGGLIDATNIFTPNLSIITSISMEHTYYLGESLTEIAYQKAGIIKEEVPVLTCEYHEDALNVVAEVAKENNSRVILLGIPVNQVIVDNHYSFTYGTYENVLIPTLSLASVKDACFAIEAVEILKDVLPFKKEDVYKGLASSKVKCRMDIINEKKTTVIIDGSHNPEAMNLLAKDVGIVSRGRPIHIVFTCFKDKNIENMLASLNLLTNDIVLTTFNHNRCRTYDEYFLYVDDYKYEENYQEAIQGLLDKYPNDIILVTGSLAFAFLVKDEIEKGVYTFKDEELPNQD